MAKKSNVVLENVELKPQVIGHTYKKKSNLGRILIVIIILILTVIYIDDITVFINNILGRETAETIKENASKNDELNFNKDSIYKELNDKLVIEKDNLVYDNFKYLNNAISFDVTNKSTMEIDMSNRKIFLETYVQKENPFLKESFKINIGVIKPNTKESFTVNTYEEFEVITLVEKNVDDYPNYSLSTDDNGIGKLSCNKFTETYEYIFKDKKLTNINHTYYNNDKNGSNYQEDYAKYQNLINSYKSLTGFKATFISNIKGFNIEINIDSATANLTNIDNIYYYPYNEEVKVINYEMETQGFNCR